MKVADSNLTPRQQKWFASVKASLERDTGKTLEQWVAIVKAECPETTAGQRKAWLKDRYGIAQNRAAQILDAAFPSADPQWDEPAALRAALWTDPASTAILHALEAAVADIPDVIPTQRKGYSAWSRNVQFAALKPLKGGKASLGIAVPPDADPRLVPFRNDSWSERLKAKMTLDGPADIDAAVIALLKAAWAKA